MTEQLKVLGDEEANEWMAEYEKKCERERKREEERGEVSEGRRGRTRCTVLRATSDWSDDRVNAGCDRAAHIATTTWQQSSWHRWTSDTWSGR
jgi:hypothetical protein